MIPFGWIEVRDFVERSVDCCIVVVVEMSADGSVDADCTWIVVYLQVCVLLEYLMMMD
jgi:hypothetical protein